jgi:hypothetical protein
MESQSLQPQIDEAQKALGIALEEACGSELDEVDTGELIRIEESLAVAMKAAKQAVSLRLRRRNQRAVSDQSAAGGAQSRPNAAESPAVTHRIFDDIRGRRWHVFAVHPSTATTERVALPAAYREGWLSFKSNEEIRRVAPIPDKWEELSIDDLRLLCYRAGVSTTRVRGLDDPVEPKPHLDS